MEQFLQFLIGWATWVWSGAILVVAVLVALLGHYLVFSAAKRVAARTESRVDDLLIQYGRKPTRLIFPLLGVFLVLAAMPLPPGPLGAIRHGLGLALIASAWPWTSGTLCVWKRVAPASTSPARARTC